VWPGGTAVRRRSQVDEPVQPVDDLRARLCELVPAVSPLPAQIENLTDPRKQNGSSR